MNINEFDPTLDQVLQLTEQTKWLTILGIDDEEWYEAVKKGRLSLRTIRVQIEKTGKTMRDEAIKFQKDIIAKERELTSIIIEEEDRLKNMEDDIKELKTKEERKKTLPIRIEELQKIWVELTDDEILAMDYDQFNSYINTKRQEILDKREADIKAKEEAIAKEEQEKVRQAEMERIKIETEEKTRIETEQRIAKEQQQRVEQEKADQEKLEKKKRYQKWLDDHGFNTDWYMVQREWNEMVMYQKISTFII